MSTTTDTPAKRSRRLLFIWGVSEIILANVILIMWRDEAGILYWIKGLIFSVVMLFGLKCLKDGFFATDADILEKMGLGAVAATKTVEEIMDHPSFQDRVVEHLQNIEQIKEPFRAAKLAPLDKKDVHSGNEGEKEEVDNEKALGMGPYLSEEELKTRRIVFIHCEDEDGCGFVVEFKYLNCTFYYCREDKVGFNVDLTTVSDAGVECQHGKMERYDLLTEDNVCPICEYSTLAILSVSNVD